MKPLFVILINYRRLPELKGTVDSLIASLPQGSRLVIVDNASPEHDVQDYISGLCAMFPTTIHAVLMDKNLGWGKAMNEALDVHSEWKEYEYVLESNNDVIYDVDWFARSKYLMEKYSGVGLLALWKHIHHGTLFNHGDILIRDNAPAVSWFFRSADLEKLLPFPEHGPTKTVGGNGEDVAFTHKVLKAGFEIASPSVDLSHHMDGYNETRLGKNNPAYE